MANTLFTALHGHGATLGIGGLSVPVRNAAIKDALLAAATAESLVPRP